MPLFGGGKTKYACRIVLLDDSEICQEITSKVVGEELLNRVVHIINLQEKDYFGLRFLGSDSTSRWIDLKKSVKKQVKPKGAFVLYFSVKFYASDPTYLREEITRYQFFLQLKRDIFLGRLPCPLEVAGPLFAFSVQSELGDFDPEIHTEGYVSEFRFVPRQTEEFERIVSEYHPKLRGTTPSESELKFLGKVKSLDLYGVDLVPVKGQDGLEYYLGLSPQGMLLFKNKDKLASFYWPRILKLKYKGKNFIMRVLTSKQNEEVSDFTFSLPSKDAAKDLWYLCVEHHAFYRLEKADTISTTGSIFVKSPSYSGKTEKELAVSQGSVTRPSPGVKRALSRRHSRRSTGYSSETGAESEGEITLSSYKVSSRNNTSHRSMPQSQSNCSVVPGDSQSASRSSKSSQDLTNSGLFGKKALTSSQTLFPSNKDTSYIAGYMSGDDQQKRKRPYNSYHSGGNRTQNLDQPTDLSSTDHQPGVADRTTPGCWYKDYQHLRKSRPRHHGSKSDSEDIAPRQQPHPRRQHRPGALTVASPDMESTPDLALSSSHQHPPGSAQSGSGENQTTRRTRRNYKNFDGTKAQVLLELGPDEDSALSNKMNQVSIADSASPNQPVHGMETYFRPTLRSSEATYPSSTVQAQSSNNPGRRIVLDSASTDDSTFSSPLQTTIPERRGHQLASNQPARTRDPPYYPSAPDYGSQGVTASYFNYSPSSQHTYPTAVSPHRLLPETPSYPSRYVPFKMEPENYGHQQTPFQSQSIVDSHPNANSEFRPVPMQRIGNGNVTPQREDYPRLPASPYGVSVRYSGNEPTAFQTQVYDRSSPYKHPTALYKSEPSSHQSFVGQSRGGVGAENHTMTHRMQDYLPRHLYSESETNRTHYGSHTLVPSELSYTSPATGQHSAKQFYDRSTQL